MSDPDGAPLLSAVELLRAYAGGELSPVEVVAAVQRRIDRLNPGLNAIVTATPELALEQAAATSGAPPDNGEPSLRGVPFTVKDTIVTRGVRTTMGSLLLQDWVPDVDAPAVERCRLGGGALLGKTNAPEFGWKGATDNRVFGPTLNPWDLACSPGGSSGGAAVAVAAGFGPIALGTDAAGSTRIPAAFCGVYGLKPSFGRVPFAPTGTIESLSHVGILARTVEDAALVLAVTAGPDPRDRFSLPAEGTDYRAAAAEGVQGLRVAWSPDLGFAAVEPTIRDRAAAAARAFEELGCIVDEVDLGLEDPYTAAYVLLAAGTAGGHRDNFDAVRDQLDPRRVPMVEDGFRYSAADVGAAIAQRGRFGEALRRALEGYDLLLTPTVPVAPFPADLDGPPSVDGVERPRLGWAALTYPFNLTGQPAATVPCARAQGEPPTGLQIVGRWRDDATVLRASAAYEAVRPWRDVWPAFAKGVAA